MYFINEYNFKNVPTKLRLFRVRHNNKEQENTKFDYLVAAAVSNQINKDSKKPVAVLGKELVGTEETELNGEFAIIVQHLGIPTPATALIAETRVITDTDDDFDNAIKRYLNKQVDKCMEDAGLVQDGRHFYDRKASQLTKDIFLYQGVYAATKNGNGTFHLVVDPKIELRSHNTILQMLKDDVEALGVASWRDLDEEQKKTINKRFRSKAYRLRTNYKEQFGKYPELSHKVYRFIEFDFSKDVTQPGQGTKDSPAEFHKRFDRNVKADQPHITVKAANGVDVSQVPELLEHQPSIEVLRRFGKAAKMQALSLMGSSDRYFRTYELTRPLAQAGIIENTPVEVAADYVGPVILDVGNDFIEVKTNYDFQEFYNKGNVFQRPGIGSIFFFGQEEYKEQSLKFVEAFKKVLKKFGLAPGKIVTDHLNLSPEPAAMLRQILDVVEKEKLSVSDLAVVINDKEKEGNEEELYYPLKGYALCDLVFGLQFFDVNTIKSVAESPNDLMKNVLSPAMMQIIAKLGGKPFGLREGFAPYNTIFLGLDRYRDPFGRNASVNAAVAAFDNHAEHICSSASRFDSGKDDRVVDIKQLMQQVILNIKRNKPDFKTENIVILRDTGEGTMLNDLLEEARAAEEVLKPYGKVVFVIANKSSNIRLYEGDPTDELGASTARPFSVVTDLERENQFIVVTTEPINIKSRGTELGTPKPMLYDIIYASEGVDKQKMKKALAKALAWLCRHSWCSSTMTRLPVPIDYADKLARIVAYTNKTLNIKASDAPRYI